MQATHPTKPQRGFAMLLIAAITCTVCLGQTAKEVQEPKRPPVQKPAPPAQKGAPQKPVAPTPANPSELTPAQQQKVLEIGHNLRLGMDLIKNDKNATEAEKVMLTQHLIETAHKALNSLLTPAQKEAFKKPAGNP